MLLDYACRRRYQELFQISSLNDRRRKSDAGGDDGQFPSFAGVSGQAVARRHFSGMPVHHHPFTLATRGQGTYEITDEVARAVQASGLGNGMATVFVRHTSCSLIIFENADPSARTDLQAYFDRLVPENAPYFEHTLEGADDMPSHLRMVLTRTSEVIPIISGRLALGTWQGVFLFEHRRAPHQRDIVVTVMGEA